MNYCRPVQKLNGYIFLIIEIFLLIKFQFLIKLLGLINRKPQVGKGSKRVLWNLLIFSHVRIFIDLSTKNTPRSKSKTQKSNLLSTYWPWLLHHMVKSTKSLGTWVYDTDFYFFLIFKIKRKILYFPINVKFRATSKRW